MTLFSIIPNFNRRGKESNGDLDLVLSHPDELKNQNFLKNLVDRLCRKGNLE